MSGNIHEFVATKNSKLAKFCDENIEVAKLFMKLVRLIVSIAEDHNMDAPGITYDAFCPKGGDVIVIRLKHPTKSFST